MGRGSFSAIRTAARRGGLLFAALALAVLCAFPARAAPEDDAPQVYAAAYLVMDADSGQVVISQGADEPHFPASITKIMTLALALEICPADHEIPVTVSEAAIAAVGPNSSMISLRPGEVLSVNDLLHATMLASANDAANVLAEYAAGSLDAFVQCMNDKAQTLGMTGTHFENPSGYHADGHYTTARDFGRLIQWALTVPGFRELFGALEYTMPATNLTAGPRHFTTDNSLLLPGALHWEGTIGGKSGWTPEARYTMTEAVVQNGHTLIVVVLASGPGQRCADCVRLLQFCAEHFYSATADADTLHLPAAEVWMDGAQIGSVPLTAHANLLLPVGSTLDDFCVELDLPDRYTVDMPYAAQAVLIHNATGETLCAIPVSPDPALLAEVLANAPVRMVSHWTRQDGITVTVGCAIIAVLALLVNWNAAFGDAVRRRAGTRAIQRLRARLPSPDAAASTDEPPLSGAPTGEAPVTEGAAE